MRTQTIETGFWKHCGRTRDMDECWPWLSGDDGKRGYGRLKAGGKRYPAHRVSWELFNGCSVPTGMQVQHSCDNPRCVNPWHLSVGDQKTNLDDACRRGRRGTHNKYKRFCARGHERIRENIYVWHGDQQCRQCVRDANRAGRLARRNKIDALAVTEPVNK